MDMKILGKRGNFLGLDDEWSDIERAKVVILPAPYEFTSSYVKGAKNGPQAILSASQQVELYDAELDVEPYKWADGVASLVPMRFDEDWKNTTAISTIKNKVQSLLGAGKFIVTLGGEHTIAIGTTKAHSAHYKNLSILQLDAHADWRQQYQGNPYSHASTMARIYTFNKRIVQVGIRSLCLEEKDFIRQHEIDTFYAHKMKLGDYNSDSPTWYDAVIDRLGELVYLTLDCDYFDPAAIPSLGTPEPGGFGWGETVMFFRKLTQSKKIVGFDVSELSPIPGLVHSEFTIAKLIYKLIGYIFNNR